MPSVVVLAAVAAAASSRSSPPRYAVESGRLESERARGLARRQGAEPGARPYDPTAFFAEGETQFSYEVTVVSRQNRQNWKSDYQHKNVRVPAEHIERCQSQVCTLVGFIPSASQAVHHATAVRCGTRYLGQFNDQERFIRIPGHTPGRGPIAPRTKRAGIARLTNVTCWDFQMHYHDPDRKYATVDRFSGRFLYTTSKREFLEQRFYPAAIYEQRGKPSLPLGEPRAHVTRACRAASDFEVISYKAHEHMLGREVHFQLFRKDGTSEPLGANASFSFYHQHVTPVEPSVHVRKGDVIQRVRRAECNVSDLSCRRPRRQTCVYDTTNKTSVTFGPSSTQEMCSGHVNILGRPGGTSSGCARSAVIWTGALLAGQDVRDLKPRF